MGVDPSHESVWPPRTDWLAYEATGAVIAVTIEATERRSWLGELHEDQLCNVDKVRGESGAAAEPPGWFLRVHVALEARDANKRAKTMTPRARQARRVRFDEMHQTQLRNVEREKRRKPATRPAHQSGQLRRLYLGWVTNIGRRQCGSCGMWDGLVKLPAWRFGCATWRCKYCLKWDQRILAPEQSGGGGP